MSKVLRADSSAALAMVEEDLGSGQTEIWHEARFFIPSATFTTWAAETVSLMTIVNAGRSASPAGAQVNVGELGLVVDGLTYTTGAAPPIGTWFRLKLHYVSGGTCELYVNGTLAVSAIDAGVIDAQIVNVGQAGGGIMYADDVKVGTTDGATDLFADDFESGDLTAWGFTYGAVAVVDDPAGPLTRHEVVVKIYDLASAELADISGICLERTWRPRHNAAASLVVQCPAGDALLTATADDGYPNLRKGNRKLLAWEDGVIFFHGRIDTIERIGSGTSNTVTVTAWDSWMELGFDADGRAGRPVRGSTTQPTAGDPFGAYDGNFISPKFASSVAAQDEISGPDLIYQVLTNSANAGAESDPAPGEGPLPIHVDVANFDLDVPPAIDLSPSDTMDWPVLIGDFVSQLVDTGVVDVRMRPIDPAEGLDPYEMNEIFAASSIGTDRTATVHFDYWTGSKNASACRHVEAFFAEINNKLYDYLGPRIDQSHWRANITPGSPGTTVDPTASRELYGGPGADKGTFMSIRVFDSVGDEASSRPLYLALWNAEQGYRIEPRDMLFITPNPDAKALFEPPTAYHVGDLIAINTGLEFGIALAAAQRVYGYDKTWDREGIARVSELLTSADPG